ncbi:MAG: ABC transporter ATP-binding protein [Gammaproteobacteria bacterium]|nr:ABC transporter ATP-binding protein [Gammaproteobacteria bacterium]
MSSAIQFSHLSKRFDHLQALDDIDFVINEGEFFGLLGMNGAGKSTLIHIMAGLLRASSGSIKVFGQDVVQDYRATRQMLGVVPQEIAYDPFFTVQEILHLQSGYFGFGQENHAWIGELLETLSLSDKADENISRLSGGMKRRVLIAQALVHHPRVIVLDEPTAGVDVDLRKALWEFSQRLHQQGHTVLLTTHYLEEAEHLCERIAILDQGHLCALDDTKNLLSQYPYRLLCLTLKNKNDVLPPELQKKQLESSGDQRVLRIHRTEDPILQVLDTIKEAGIEILDLKMKEPTLEDVFLKLTHGHRAERI